MGRKSAFTLIELLVVISIIAMLIGILLPALGSTRDTAKAMKCMSNIRQIETAHYSYMNDHDGHMIDVKLGHNGTTHGTITFIEALQHYWSAVQDSGFGPEIRARSPLDDSPHWGPLPEGEPIDNAPPDQRRRTSYGLPDFLTSIGPPGKRFRNLDLIPVPSANVHVMVMAFGGDFAGADHVHPTLWYSSLPQFIPNNAASQAEISAVGGPQAGWDSKSNWGFLDGHVETLEFSEVYRSDVDNQLDPTVAR